jgi:predicted helicase
LDHPGYRQKYADNLKRELPRLPFAPEFRPFANAH